MTTVGYGDMVPDTDIAKAFTIGYIVFGLSMGATCLGIVVGQLQGSLEAQASSMPKAQRRRRKIASSLLSIMVLIGMGACFVMWSEGLEPLDAAYWAVVTASSVGYGDITSESVVENRRDS